MFRDPEGRIVIQTPEDGELVASALDLPRAHDGFAVLYRGLDPTGLPRPLGEVTTRNVLNGLETIAAGTPQTAEPAISIAEARALLDKLKPTS